MEALAANPEEVVDRVYSGILNGVDQFVAGPDES